MTKTVIQFIALFAVLLLAQVICSKIVLFNVAMPVIFIYLIMRLPINLHINWTLTIAFLLGLVVDIFNNTQGMNALACTLLAAVRRLVFTLYVPRDDEMGNPLPSIASMGVGAYVKFMSTFVLLYCFVLFMIQAFTLRDFPLTLMRIVASSVLSIVLILAIDSLVSTSREKRL